MRNVLLIVDDMPDVARSLQRCLARSFEKVVVAHSPEEAERLLGDPDNPPTHLVCDHFLGQGKRQGADLIPVWRTVFKQVRVAVLLTGSELGHLVQANGIDKIVTKPVNVRELGQFLLAAGSCGD